MTTFRLLGQPILLALVLALGVRNAVRIYSIPTASMEPTLQAGDHIVVTPYHQALPQRGDIVVFRSPIDAETLLVKRIVAVPGDLVETHAGRLFVDGHALAEPYVWRPALTGQIASQIVPSGCYFVLGDNRANSLDSRQWGVLSQHLLIGRARLILWASAPVGVERLFKPIQ